MHSTAHNTTTCANQPFVFLFFRFSLSICGCACVWEDGLDVFRRNDAIFVVHQIIAHFYSFIYSSYKYVIKENTYYIHFACHYHHHRVGLSCLIRPIISNAIMMNEDDCSLRLSAFLLKNCSRIDVFCSGFVLCSHCVSCYNR